MAFDCIQVRSRVPSAAVNSELALTPSYQETLRLEPISPPPTQMNHLADCKNSLMSLHENYDKYLNSLPQKQKEYHNLVMSARKNANYPLNKLSAPLLLAKQQRTLIEAQYQLRQQQLMWGNPQQALNSSQDQHFIQKLNSVPLQSPSNHPLPAFGQQMTHMPVRTCCPPVTAAPSRSSLVQSGAVRQLAQPQLQMSGQNMLNNAQLARISQFSKPSAVHTSAHTSLTHSSSLVHSVPTPVHSHSHSVQSHPRTILPAQSPRLMFPLQSNSHSVQITPTLITKPSGHSVQHIHQTSHPNLSNAIKSPQQHTSPMLQAGVPSHLVHSQPRLVHSPQVTIQQHPIYNQQRSGQTVLTSPRAVQSPHLQTHLQRNSPASQHPTLTTALSTVLPTALTVRGSPQMSTHQPIHSVQSTSQLAHCGRTPQIISTSDLPVLSASQTIHTVRSPQMMSSTVHPVMSSSQSVYSVRSPQIMSTAVHPGLPTTQPIHTVRSPQILSTSVYSHVQPVLSTTQAVHTVRSPQVMTTAHPQTMRMSPLRGAVQTVYCSAQPIPQTIRQQPVPQNIRQQPVPQTVRQTPVPQSVRQQQPVPQNIRQQPVPQSVRQQPVPQTIRQQPVPQTISNLITNPMISQSFKHQNPNQNVLRNQRTIESNPRLNERIDLNPVHKPMSGGALLQEQPLSHHCAQCNIECGLPFEQAFQREHWTPTVPPPPSPSPQRTVIMKSSSAQTIPEMSALPPLKKSVPQTVKQTLDHMRKPKLMKATCPQPLVPRPPSSLASRPLSQEKMLMSYPKVTPLLAPEILKSKPSAEEEMPLNLKKVCAEEDDEVIVLSHFRRESQESVISRHSSISSDNSVRLRISLTPPVLEDRIDEIMDLIDDKSEEKRKEIRDELLSIEDKIKDSIEDRYKGLAVIEDKIVNRIEDRSKGMVLIENKRENRIEDKRVDPIEDRTKGLVVINEKRVDRIEDKYKELVVIENQREGSIEDQSKGLVVIEDKRVNPIEDRTKGLVLIKDKPIGVKRKSIESDDEESQQEFERRLHLILDQLIAPKVGSREESPIQLYPIENELIIDSESKLIDNRLEYEIPVQEFARTLDLIGSRDLKRKPRAYLNARHPLNEISRSIYAGIATKKSVLDFAPKFKQLVEEEEEPQVEQERPSKRQRISLAKVCHVRRDEANDWSFVLSNLDFCSPLSQRIVGVLPHFQFKT